MPVTAPELSRRALLAGCLAACARAADPAREVWELIGKMAAALGTGDAGEFLSVCDPAMPGFEALRANVNALIAQADVESAIDPVRDEGGGEERRVEVDWQLHLTGRAGLGRVTTRRAAVVLRVARRGGKWKVTSIEPAAFFAPPSA